jgi:peroxiredoxin
VFLAPALLPVPLARDLALATEPSVDGPRRELQVAPDGPRRAFALKAIDGTSRDLRDLAGQDGRLVLVHFFATWCEPCREELASLDRLMEQRAATGLSIVAVNVAEPGVRVQRFLESAPVAFPVLLDADRALTKAWRVSVLPTTFVLDRSLVARLFVEGDIDWARPDILAALEQIGAGGR